MNDMWHDEQDVRNALQRIVDTPAPAVHTDLSEVVRRGKRRVLVTRLGAVASVIVAVGGIGLGATALSGSLFSGDPTELPPAASSTSATAAPTSAELPPGFTQPPPLPQTTTVDGSRSCVTPDPKLPSGRAILPEDKYLPAFEKAVAAVGEGKVGVVFKNYVNANRGHATVQVMPSNNKPGYVRLETGRFGGTVEEIADSQRYRNGCQEPARMPLPNGALVQLYPDTDYGRVVNRSVSVYLPSGRWYILTAGPGLVDNSGYPKLLGQEAVKPDDLPLTKEKLVQVVKALADLG